RLMISEMHKEHFRIVLHEDKPPRKLHGSVTDTGAAASNPDDAAYYWKEHLKVFDLGVDGWWADEGDWLSAIACLVRNRMYWEGSQLARPNVRPYALNRNGYAGIQRYGWLWSGDITSTWQTLREQIAVGLNTGLSGMPYWGTDTGGFVTTPELTGELYARWFQFSTFCPLFRSHGRTWKLRLPWGWDTGSYGPIEGPKSSLPPVEDLHDSRVEPICRKYLDLRYRLLPYLYMAVREAHDSGLPIMRALWLHYPDDPRAVERDDEYLWGPRLLIAPVVEKGARDRKVYLPRGIWYDFWTEERLEGGREITRPVDLATIPVYARAGALLPFGPAKQYTTEKSQSRITLVVYPGMNGNADLYDDDGLTFNFRRGEFTRTRLAWLDETRRLGLSLEGAGGGQLQAERRFEARVVPEHVTRQLNLTGRTASIEL
ncbi:MAG: TIM-barrel domain-containing protein, partial [Terriglobia bacterium]